MSTIKSRSNKNHQFFMKLAFKQASRVLGNTGVNPAVGCVVVKKNNLLNLAHTNFNGTPHAEKIALLGKKKKFRNSVLWNRKRNKYECKQTPRN